MKVMDNSTQAVAPEVKKVRSEMKGKRIPFYDYLNRSQGKWIKSLAEDLSQNNSAFKSCEKRGIMNLLDFRPIRLHIGYTLSYIYALQFEGVRPSQGDSRDAWHAVLASSSDAFVSHDQRFARLMDRIPGKGLEVFNHLSAFISRF